MSKRYYRIQTADRDVNDLLDPTEQVSRAWHRDDLDREGVSVCESRQELAAYLATVGSGIPYGQGEWVVVELTGTLSDATPLDAEAGELLVHPTQIISVTPMDDEFFEMIAAALDEAA
jgi:hypothetical protein